MLATLGPLGGVLAASWGLSGRLGGLLAAKTHQKRGGCEFLRPLGVVLASFLKGFWMVLGLLFQHFSYLILQDVNMS